VETLNILEEEEILKKNVVKSKLINDLLNEKFGDHPNIGDIRQLGLIAAVEIVKNKESKEKFSWEERIGFQVYKKALKIGCLLRPLGDVIYFMPPYVITEDEIEFMIDVAFKSINEVLANQ